MTAELRAGERVLLVDHKKRRYLVTLADGGEFHSHAGVVPHDAIIGEPEGISLRATRGGSYTAIRPTLAEFVLKMPRGAQVIYPKDLGPILMLADIYPGARVLESGVGSGALSMAMVRAGADVVGYELRERLRRTGARQRRVVPRRGGRRPATASSCATATRASTRPTSTASCSTCPSRGTSCPTPRRRCGAGGILVAYTPSIVQATQLREALDEHQFQFAETLEVLHRTWHIEGAAVRPDHRMVAHTGFLTHARRLGI